MDSRTGSVVGPTSCAYTAQAAASHRRCAHHRRHINAEIWRWPTTSTALRPPPAPSRSRYEARVASANCSRAPCGHRAVAPEPGETITGNAPASSGRHQHPRQPPTRHRPPGPVPVRRSRPGSGPGHQPPAPHPGGWVRCAKHRRPARLAANRCRHQRWPARPATNANRHQLGSNSYLPMTPMTVSRPTATGALLIATEAKAPSKLQRSDPPWTLASRVTRDGTTSCRSIAGPKGRSIGTVG